MGQAKVKETLYTQIFGNVLNIILDAVFVLYLDFGVAGVAFASLISQVITFIIGMYLIARSTSFSLLSYLGLARMSRKDLKVIISSNTDLLLRTVCILTFFNVMARMGSQLGADILATNAILMQVTFIVSYMFDGVANASSVFSGKAVGAKDPELLKRVVSLNVQWTTLFVAIATAFIILFQNQLVLLFTQIPSLIAIYHEMSPWLTVFPLVAGFGLTFYGIFTGTGTTVPVRNSSIATLAVFLFVVWATVENWGNHGLWLAFTIFYIGRFAFLVPFLRQVFAKAV